jgi:hypothetical protein
MGRVRRPGRESVLKGHERGARKQAPRKWLVHHRKTKRTRQAPNRNLQAVQFRRQAWRVGQRATQSMPVRSGLNWTRAGEVRVVPASDVELAWTGRVYARNCLSPGPLRKGDQQLLP